MGKSAKLGEPVVVPAGGAHGRSLHIPASETLGCERADGSAADARRPSCVGMGLQVQQGASLGIPWGPQGADIAPLPALQGWALIDLGPALARAFQRGASSAACGAAGRAACRPPALALALGSREQRPGWDGSPPLPRTVRSASGLRGQTLRGGRRAAAPALVQAPAVAPAGSAGLAPSSRPIVSPDLCPIGPVSTGPTPAALVAELAAGLAELRRLRSVLIGPAAGPRTAAEPALPSLPSLQARRGSRAPCGARRSDHKRGCAGSERGRSPPGHAPGPPSARPHRARRAGSAPARRPAFGRAALGRPTLPLAAAATPQPRRAACPASVGGEPVRRSGATRAVPERRPAGSACASPTGVARSPRTVWAPAAPAPQEQRRCIAWGGGVAPGGYAPHDRMQARPGAGAMAGAVAPRQPACSRAPAASGAQPAAEAGRHAAAPAAGAHVQAGRGDAGEGGACAAAAPPPCSMPRAPSCSSALSSLDPAVAGKLGGEKQGSERSARSSASGSQGRSRGARGGGGSGSGGCSAGKGGATERLCSSQSWEYGSRAGVAQARGLCSGSHSGDGRLVQQAGCAQYTSLPHPAPLADGAAVPATAQSVSSAGSVDPGLAGLVCIRLGDGTRRSSDGGRAVDMARAAEAHGAAAVAPALTSLMEPGGPLRQPAYGRAGPGGGPPSLGAGTGPQVPQLAHARNRPAGMQAACRGQPRPPQQAGPEAAVSAPGAAARAGPRLPVPCTGQSPGAGAALGLASVPHAGAPPALLSAVVLRAGPCPAAHSAAACQKVADWLRASAAPGPTSEAPSAAGCAHASSHVSGGRTEARAPSKSSAVCSGAAHSQGALPLPGQSPNACTPALPAGQLPARKPRVFFRIQCATVCSRASSSHCV